MQTPKRKLFHPYECQSIFILQNFEKNFYDEQFNRQQILMLKKKNPSKRRKRKKALQTFFEISVWDWKFLLTLSPFTSYFFCNPCPRMCFQVFNTLFSITRKYILQGKNERKICSKLIYFYRCSNKTGFFSFRISF